MKTGLLHCRSTARLRCDLRRMAGSTGLSGWHDVRRAGADSPSVIGKQAKFANGRRPAGCRAYPERGYVPSPEAGNHERPRHGVGQGPLLPGDARRMQETPGHSPLSPALLRKRKEGPLSESLHLSDQSGMRITSWIYAHRAVRRAGPCCGSRYGRCRTGA